MQATQAGAPGQGAGWARVQSGAEGSSRRKLDFPFLLIAHLFFILCMLGLTVSNASFSG